MFSEKPPKYKLGYKVVKNYTSRIELKEGIKL